MVLYSSVLEILSWPMLAWLRARSPVIIQYPDGACYRSWLIGGRLLRPLELVTTSTTTPFTAHVLPDDAVLVRQLTLPDLPLPHLEQALALQVAALSPFSPEATVWGWRMDQREARRISVTLALTSRQQVEQVLQPLGMAGAEPVELWASAVPPLILQGFAEKRRYRYETLRTLNRVAIVTLSALLLMLSLALPWWQVRAQAIEAQQRLQDITGAATELMQQREALALNQSRVMALQAQVDDSLDILGVLEVLATDLPDTTYLQTLTMRGSTVTLSGFGREVAAQIEQLGQHPAISGLRTTTAITRVAETSNEQFGLEFTYTGQSSRND